MPREVSSAFSLDLFCGAHAWSSLSAVLQAVVCMRGVVPSPHSLSRAQAFKQQVARTAWLWPAAATISAILGGMAADAWGITTVILTGVIPLGIAVCCALMLQEPPRVPVDNGAASTDRHKGNPNEQAGNRQGRWYLVQTGAAHAWASALAVLTCPDLCILMWFGICTYAFSESIHQVRLLGSIKSRACQSRLQCPFDIPLLPAP